MSKVIIAFSIITVYFFGEFNQFYLLLYTQFLLLFLSIVFFYFNHNVSFTGGHKRKSLNEISELYKELSTRIFTQSTLRGTSNLVWSQAYYDTALWEQMLQENLGNRDLIKTARDPIAPKVSLI